LSDWWRNAVIYQVYPRSFADGNNDGTGDLIGLRNKLGYLQRLGVDAIWLSPFFTSPMNDGGYDVSNYRDVDPRFGTLADFDTMIKESHALGIRVIIDIVPNHTSSEHPWFKAGLRDRYIFRPSAPDGGPPNDWQSIFGGPAWTQVDDGSWYLHLFDPTQPDLDWNNPVVRAEFLDILRFWLDRGVDGFRIDVAHGMIKADGLPSIGASAQSELLTTEILPYFDQDGVHDIYREWRPVLDSYGAMAVAEAWVSSPARLARYIGADELHQAFNFDFMMASFDAESFRTVIDASLEAAEIVGAPTTWVLSNHDRQRHVTRHGSLSAARAATLLMLALPGGAYLYNGEELGLDEVLDLPDELREDPAFLRTGESRDGCRVPLPWGTGDSAWTNPWLPQPAHWATLTAEAQEADPHSTLNFYRAALEARRTITGPLEWLDSPTGVLRFRRGAHEILINVSGDPVPLTGNVILTSSPLPPGSALPPATAAWLHP
jgi:alpha-glucosidase